jgi:class 3 adenylate cyclase
VIAAWAIVSLAELPPLKNAVKPTDVTGPLAAVGGAGVVAYAWAAFAYFRVYARRRSGLAFAVAFAFALLAEALTVAVLSLATSWQLSWWEWHGLMVIGFLSIGGAAWREWNEERFSALYLDETLRGHKEVTVLFADLAGFTPFTEAHGSAEVHSMLVTYFGRLAPMIRDEFDGEVAEFVGDQIFAVFNKAGDQPDHAVRAARAGLALQRVAAEIRAESGHPDWPHFRCGINTGEVLAGVVGDRGHRIHGVFGDTVNLGSRLEGQSPVDGVMIGEATYAQLPAGAVAERQPDLQVKGKAKPVVGYVLVSVPSGVRSTEPPEAEVPAVPAPERR